MASGSPAPRRPTINDVAKRAGVSRSTVSLVLQASPLVKAATRSRVLAAIKQLGYVYNRSAANLRGAGRGLIGLIINDLRNPFFTEFAASVQHVLSQSGYATVLANTDESLRVQTQVTLSMLEHGVDGLLICPCLGTGKTVFDRIRAAHVPALQVLRRMGQGASRLPFFTMDYATGGRLAAEHLIASGARRIAFVGGVEGAPVTEDRMAGYLQALRAHDLRPVALHGRATRQFGRVAAANMAAEPRKIEAVVCFNDLVALGMIAGFAQHGVAVGADVKLVGFDDIEECRQAHPQLSSVRCDVSRFGKLAAAKLLAWCKEGTVPAKSELLQVELAVRASTAADRALSSEPTGAR